jgi:hypothetical protein
MSTGTFSRATHFSIVWVVTLAVLTTLEWRSLDREPLKETIMLPFIERDVRVTLGAENDIPAPGGEERKAAPLSRTVEVGFNGPLFLLCSFGPVLVFQGLGWLARRAERGVKPDGGAS